MGDFIFGAGCGVILLLAVIIMSQTIFAPNETNYQEAISFTAIDHDESDHTIYTSDGEILTTNKYQWKLIELNKTYVCDDRAFNGVSNCRAIEVSP